MGLYRAYRLEKVEVITGFLWWKNTKETKQKKYILKGVPAGIGGLVTINKTMKSLEEAKQNIDFVLDGWRSPNEIAPNR